MQKASQQTTSNECENNEWRRSTTNDAARPRVAFVPSGNVGRRFVNSSTVCDRVRDAKSGEKI